MNMFDDCEAGLKGQDNPEGGFKNFDRKMTDTGGLPFSKCLPAALPIFRWPSEGRRTAARR